MSGGLAISKSPRSVRAGKALIENRFAHIGAAAVVVREFANMVLQHVAINLLNCLRHLEMEALAQRGRQRTEHRLASKLVGELKAGLATVRARENKSCSF